jgi:hypothetical protein
MLGEIAEAGHAPRKGPRENPRHHDSADDTEYEVDNNAAREAVAAAEIDCDHDCRDQDKATQQEPEPDGCDHVRLNDSVYTSSVTTASICVTCGTQFSASEGVPEGCPICQDYRQFVGLDGQRWTTLEDLRAGHRNTVTAAGDGVYSIHTEPKFGIGQRCLLVQSAQGNILWDCVSLLDEETAAQVRALGGIGAIAISHPHYYSTMLEWSAVFGAPVYIHESDRAWVMRSGEGIRFWGGEQYRLNDTMTLVRCGGHFEGAQVMHDAGRRACRLETFVNCLTPCQPNAGTG